MANTAKVWTSIFRNWIVILTLLLIFAGIAVYGGEYVWQEASLFAAIFLISGVVIALGSDRLPHFPRPLLLPVLLLSAYSILQGLLPLLFGATTPADSESLPFGFDAVASIWSGVKILAFAAVLCLSVASLRVSHRAFVGGLIFVGSMFAVFGIVRVVLQSSIPELNNYFFAYELKPNVGFGTFLNQNHFAMLMVMTLGLSIGQLVIAKDGAIKKVALLMAALVSWIATVMTVSRAGIIGSFFVVATLIAYQVGLKVVASRKGNLSRATVARSLLGSVVIICALVAGVIFVGQGHVMQRFAELPEQMEGTDGTAFRRTDVWEAAVKMIKLHIPFGVGFGGFQYGVAQHIEIAGDIVPKQAHNDYLELLASGGLIALGLFAWSVYGFYSESRKAFRKETSTARRAARVGAMCGIVGVAFHSLADYGLQYAGNMFFFAALIAISTFLPDNPRTKRARVPLFWRRNTAVSIILGFVLFGVCSAFAVSRYSISSNRSGADGLKGLPFDAEYFSAKAQSLSSAGNFGGAADALRTATLLRTQDYSLWLRLARLEADRGNASDAEEAYRTSIKLAPFFGEPRYFYGKFLLETSRIDEAFNELAFAARRDDRYTDAALEMIREKTNFLPLLVMDLSLTGRNETRTIIIRFLLSNREYALLTNVLCRASFSELERDMTVRQLLERREYHSAWRIYSGQCEDRDELPVFIDGGFERARLRKGFGFGWMIGESVRKPNIAVDDDQFAEGGQSLRFTFDGEIETPLLRQMIPVRSGAEYEVSFAYKSRGILSGGLPTVQVVSKQRDNSLLAADVVLSSDTDEWERKVLSFRADAQTEAVEVLLTRRPCGQKPCPIFGQLWIDGFELIERKNGSSR